MSMETIRRRLDRIDSHSGFPPVVFVDEGPGVLTEEEAAAEVERLTREYNGHVHIIRHFWVDMDEVDAAGLADTFVAMSRDEQIEALRAYRRRALG